MKPPSERFTQRIAEAARAAGYDIDSPRGGGKKALADATGMSQSSVGRMLAGRTLPDPYFLEPLGQAVNIPIGEMLVLAGITPHDPFAEDAPPPRLLSARAAAAALGIEDPLRVQLFEAMVDVLVKDDPDA